MSTSGKKILKPVIYKRAEFHIKKQGDTLKTLLDAALINHSTVGQRRKNVSPDPTNPVWQLIGASQSEKDGFVFGMLMTYSPGIDPLFLVDDVAAETIILEKLGVPNTKDGKRRELLESILFFGIIRNHLVLMQSQGLKSPQLESYLQWFLHDTAVLAGDNTLQLLDTPTQAIKDRVAKGQGVRSIKLGGEVLPPSTMQSTIASKVLTPENKTKSISVTGTSSDSEWGPLAAIKSLMQPSQAAMIDFDKLSGSNIELTVTLRYKSKTTDDGHKLMDTLGTAFRNTDEVDTEIEFIDGSTIKGSELKLHGAVRVTSYDGQLSESEVNEALRQWLLSKIESQEVLAAG